MGVEMQHAQKVLIPWVVLLHALNVLLDLLVQMPTATPLFLAILALIHQGTWRFVSPAHQALLVQRPLLQLYHPALQVPMHFKVKPLALPVLLGPLALL